MMALCIHSRLILSFTANGLFFLYVSTEKNNFGYIVSYMSCDFIFM